MILHSNREKQMINKQHLLVLSATKNKKGKGTRLLGVAVLLYISYLGKSSPLTFELET